MSTSATEMQQSNSMSFGDSLDILSDALSGEGQLSEATATPGAAVEAHSQSQTQTEAADTRMQSEPERSVPAPVEQKITAEMKKFIDQIKKHDHYREGLSYDNDIDPFLEQSRNSVDAPCVSDLDLGDGKDWRKLPYLLRPFEEMQGFYVHSEFFYKWKRNVKIDANEFELCVNNVIFRPSEKGFVICNFEMEGEQCKCTDTSIVYSSLEKLQKGESTDKKLRELESIGRDELFITIDTLINSDSHLLEHLRTKCLTRELNKYKMGELLMDQDNFGTSLDAPAITKFENDVKELTESACPYLTTVDPKKFTSKSTWRKSPYIIILSQKLGLLDITFFSYAYAEPLDPALEEPDTSKKKVELRTKKITVKPNMLGIEVCNADGIAEKHYSLAAYKLMYEDKAPQMLFEKLIEEQSPSDMAIFHRNGTHIVYEIPFAHLMRAEQPLFEYLAANRETLDARKKQMLEKHEAKLKEEIRRNAARNAAIQLGEKAKAKGTGAEERKGKAEQTAADTTSGQEGIEKKKDAEQKKDSEKKTDREEDQATDDLEGGAHSTKLARALEMVRKHRYYKEVSSDKIVFAVAAGNNSQREKDLEKLKKDSKEFKINPDTGVSEFPYKALQEVPYVINRSCLEASKFGWDSWPYVLRPSDVHPGYFSLSFFYYDCTAAHLTDDIRFKMTCMEIEFRPDMVGDKCVFQTYSLEDDKTELEVQNTFNTIDELVKDTFSMFARNAMGRLKFWISFKQLFEETETLTQIVMNRKLGGLVGGHTWRARSMAALAGGPDIAGGLSAAALALHERRKEYSLQGLSEEEQLALALSQSEEASKQAGQSSGNPSSGVETKARADKAPKGKPEDYTLSGLTEQQQLERALRESAEAHKASGAGIGAQEDDDQDMLQEAIRLSMGVHPTASEPVTENKEKEEGRETKEREEKEHRDTPGAASHTGSQSPAKKLVDATPGLYLSGFATSPLLGSTSSGVAGAGDSVLSANATDGSSREGKRTDKNKSRGA